MIFGMASLQTYQLTSAGPLPLEVPAESLDQVTRQLPGGLYTTFRTYGGGARVLGLQEHLNRLYLPADEQGITPDVNDGKLRQFLRGLCAALKPAESRVRLVLSATDHPGACFAVIEPFAPPPAWIYERGVRVVTFLAQRKAPRLKSTAFIAASAEARQKLTGGLYEALLVRPDPGCEPDCPGCVLEGMTSNFYALQGHTLITARSGILLGVTRRVVIRLARQAGLSLDYRPPCLDETWDEAFITSSSRGVVPVVEIDGKPLGQGAPGPVARRLNTLYNDYVEKKAELI
jgi:branched-chain amino acid aminotransferase